jgi:phospholipid transport system transporter-binding protein
MISRSGDRLEVAGAMTLPFAPALLSAGLAELTGDESVFDLTHVAEVDSSGLAVLFAWLRAAKSQGKTIRVANPPKNLLSLAEVYGVADLLPTV